MKTILDHPAVKLGLWLKELRQARGFVKRIFAEKIQLSPSKYTEVEAGVVRWIEDKQEEAIIATTEMSKMVTLEFRALLTEAREAVALAFSNLFTREQLTPLRSRLSSDRAIGEMERTMILDAVFAPLA
jgi:hypothetical protein